MSHAGQRGRESAIVHRTAHDFGDDTDLSTRVLLTLDSVPGYDVENGDTVVFDHVDLDALDALFRPVGGTARDGRVSFTVDEYEVTATASGAVTVRNGRTQ